MDYGGRDRIVRVVRIVVVHIPVIVHIEHIVRVTGIRGTPFYKTDLPYNNFEKFKDITFFQN